MGWKQKLLRLTRQVQLTSRKIVKNNNNKKEK